MTVKEAPADQAAELEQMRRRISDLEEQNTQQGDTIATLNGVVGQYQQMHADAILTGATLRAQFEVAQRRLTDANAAQ